MFAEHLGEDIDKKVCLECQRQFTGIVAACPHDGTTLVTLARDPMIGTCLMGKYDIIDVIGHGGMGVVYKGRQVLMERIVAIKMLQSQHIADSMSVKRFHQEGKASSKFNHPHIITVYDFGVTPSSGQPFIVMDYLSGIALSDLIKNEGHLGVERSIKILCQSTDALDHAHRMGVIHRDLKPSNIMLIDYEDEKDYVKVVDFGVAKLITAGGEQQKLTQMGEVCGSPVYMSPEQVQGLDLDNRSDIYSMGVVIYETLTGRLPILGKTMVETMSKHITEMPPRFNDIRPDLYIPERLEAVVFKAMAKSPADRHQTMAELTRDLETAIPRAGKSQVLRADFPTMPDLSEKKKEKVSLVSKMGLMHWVLVAACVLLTAGLVLMAVFTAKKPPGTATVAPASTPTASVAPGSVPSVAPSATPANPMLKAVNTSTPGANSAQGTAAVEEKGKTASVEAPPVAPAKKDTARVKQKVAAAPRLSRKPKHHSDAGGGDESPVGNSGSAAAYARQNPSAVANPFNNLIKSRSY
ncbi:MAG: protein kinase [Cyanobacteria bacterium REEB67]|nr:protein kinase [Cyanobacteria bacterium REEB67]